MRQQSESKYTCWQDKHDKHKGWGCSFERGTHLAVGGVMKPISNNISTHDELAGALTCMLAQWQRIPCKLVEQALCNACLHTKYEHLVRMQ